MPEAATTTTHDLAALVHGRYHVDPSAGEGAPLLVGFHGYGETAAAHLEELRRIPGNEGWLLCAVEGLHRFYTRDQRVVGSWMTRVGRERAIVDNLRYVIGAIADVRRRYRPSPVLVFAGFSQGVAMAYRAAAGCGLPCHGVIALAGDVPPDVAARADAFGSSDRPKILPPVLIGRGKDDEWYDEGKMTADLATLERIGVDAAGHVFDGGHEWHDAFREATGKFLDSVS